MANTRSESFTQVSVPDGYAQYLLSQLFEPWAAVLTARARIRPGQRVLDVASGLGPVARLAAAWRASWALRRMAPASAP